MQGELPAPSASKVEGFYENSWLRPARWYRCWMAGYSRPFSRSELRQIRRAKWRIISWCAVVVLFVLAGVAGLIFLIYKQGPH
jgi:hypothetical protein